ncbi:YhgE/Pip family protein [Cryobacterium sp. Hh38]|uniref:YhgE/Pip family protein n=1 Tax=Cryobacterium sp. Hh38 TaxID=1259156 RepID=UPI00106C7F9E|nr:YhgE/Pip family protein [Cryobacterium sp. Hh38]TFD59558.1 YhgE/Pip domain-containing protein [Cryobacterium sp. Hh38]
MSTALDKLFSRTARQRRLTVAALVAVVVAVPLAVAGLFTVALVSADDRVDTIPAIVVNNDEFVTTTLPDGTEQQVLAGRLLVTELTAPSASDASTAGFDWTISNTADAQAALAAGDAYAILTIPSDFSASINSLSGSTPVQADLDIRTDDAHSYLAGSLAQSVGSAMTGAFGQAITAQYLEGLYTNLALLGSSLTDAADGAAALSTGVSGVKAGLDSLAAGTATAATGAASAASGATSYASGVASYTDGVTGLSAGLTELKSGAGALAPLETGLPAYASGVQGTAAAFTALNAQMQADPNVAAYAGALAQIQGGLTALGAQSPGIGAAGTGIGSVLDGISSSANGALTLAAGGPALSSGASDLATGVQGISAGLGTLASGTQSAQAGTHALEAGAAELATGLADGAAGASVFTDTDTDAATTAAVVSEPVSVTTERDHLIDSAGPIIGMIFVPVGLWIGALVVFLLFKPLTASALASTTSTGRLLRRGLGRAFAIVAGQAVLVTVLLHTALDVAWTLLPATLGFALLLAFVFVAVQHWLSVAFGRVGIVISLVLLALQLAAASGLYPIELVAAPFQALSPFLPLTWAVNGLQAIVSESGGADVAAAAAILLLFAIGSVLLSFWSVARARGARSFGLGLARA